MAGGPEVRLRRQDLSAEHARVVEDDDALRPLDPAVVLRDTEACDALRDLGARLRELGYDGSPNPAGRTPERTDATLVALARGRDVPRADALRSVGPEPATALRRAGVLLCVGDEACLSTKLFPMRSVLTLLPANEDDLDVVYLGQDSVCLFEIVWAAGGHGHRAADLGTGNGFIAAALATRFDQVVAADLSARCCATAALVPVLNPHLASRFSTVRLDVAEGLRPATFDLVAANAPWVPETAGPDGGPPRRFAAGGPTGFELPRRFLDQAAGLLAPGGRAFVACTDLTFDDGRRPLTDHLPNIAARGLAIDVAATRMNELGDFTEWARRRTAGVRAARHVVVTLRRPA